MDKCKDNGDPCHQKNKFSPLTANAEKTEHYTQALGIRVADLQRRFLNLDRLTMPRSGLNKEKYGIVSHGMRTCGLIFLELLNPQIAQIPSTTEVICSVSAPSLLEDNMEVSDLQENLCIFHQYLPQTPLWTSKIMISAKSQHKPVE